MMKNVYLIAAVLIFQWFNLQSQNAPVTTCQTVPAVSGDTAYVPIIVTDFNDIGAISLSIDYDYSVIQFIEGQPNPALSFFQTGDADLGNGLHRVSMGWFGSSTSLPDNSTIITLVFNYIGGNGPLEWFDNGASCEYADAFGNVLNDVPAEDFYINGYVCGQMGDTGPITGNDTVCEGSVGETYSVASLSNVSGYEWTVPQGVEITGGANTNSITVTFTENAVSGMFRVYPYNACMNGDTSELAVTVAGLPIADAGNDTTINFGTSTTLHAASGGTGSYSYHWFPEDKLVDPFVQNPQTVILNNSSLFTVEVTNTATGCLSSDDVLVSITGGPLTVSPVAVPDEICSGNATQLFSNAGGGSGDYTYEWTSNPPGNPPWTSNLPNPEVLPDSSTQYYLSVFDGFTSTSGVVYVEVNELPTATISGGDTLCGSGNTTILTVDLTGTPPWSFNYSNGVSTYSVTNQLTTPYTIVTGEAGEYTVSDLSDANCTGETFGSATVAVFAVPATPEITVIGNKLISNVPSGNQWYLDGEPVPGATGQIYEATQSGWYFDIVTINGCSSDTSEIVDIMVGLEEPDKPGFTIAPNPASDLVRIIYPRPVEKEATVTLLSADGREIRRLRFEPQGAINEFILDIGGLTPGFYFVSLREADNFSINKLIKQ